MQNEDENRVGRVERIRRMLEERTDDPDLFSRDHRSLTPWNLASQRQAKKPGSLDVDSIFSDVRINVVDAVDEGDRVVVRWRLRGNWTGALPFGRVKPTGQPVDLTGILMYRFVGNRIVENTGVLDVGSFHEQACERTGENAKRVNPEQCVEMLQALAGQPGLIEGGGGGPF